MTNRLIKRYLIALLLGTWISLSPSLSYGTSWYDPIQKLQDISMQTVSLVGSLTYSTRQFLCDSFVRRYTPSGVESHSSIRCFKKDSINSTNQFQEAVARLANVNQWGDGLRPAGQKFSLYSKDGEPLNRPARAGDFVKIRMRPAPVSDDIGKASALGVSALEAIDRYIWVRVQYAGEASPEDAKKLGVDKRFVISVRPTYDPTKKPPTGVTEHMFSKAAVNHFYIDQVGDQIQIGVHGFREMANLEPGVPNTEAIVNIGAANASWGPVVDSNGMSGSSGIQKAIWTSYVDKMSKGLTREPCTKK